MSKISLLSPTRRAQIREYTEFRYSRVSVTYLPTPIITKSRTFLSVLEKRRSSRAFGPLPLESLNSFLWCSARSMACFNEDLPLEHRPSPSAGGLHPIDLIIREGNKSLVYDSQTHSLAEISVNDSTMLKLGELADAVFPCGEGTTIWFGAQHQKTAAKYDNSESLIWRDAGALIATMNLVAEYLELNFCPFGITGEPFLSEALESEAVVGVGGICVGTRLQTANES